MGLVQIEDGQVFYYPYTPSRTAGLAFVALFTTVTIAHIGCLFFYRTRFFIPFILGGICKHGSIYI